MRKPPAYKQTHSDLRQAVQDYLRLRGAVVYGNLGGLGQVRGRADLTACLRGGAYCDIEIKTGSGVQSREQREQQARVEQAGGIYILARSVEDVEAQLVELGMVTPCLI